MRITVFGANGKVGRLVVRYALQNGHEVVAFVHKAHLPARPRLTVMDGDVYSAADVKRALKGSDAVISALGSWGTPQKDILTMGMRRIIPAMKQYDISRIVTLTGADARDPRDHAGLLNNVSRGMLRLVAPKILQDGEEHMHLLRQSGLDWTVLRSPIMRKRGRKGRYVLLNKLPSPFATISRKDVAAALVALAETDKFKKQAPVIFRK